MTHLPECYKEGSTDSCICDELRACEQRVDEHWKRLWDAYSAGLREELLDAARGAVLAYADDTDKHIGMVKCWPENGDRCDITAALRVAARQIDALREEQK